MKTLVRVSDHALVRFLDRSGLVDTEALRAEIAARVDPAARLGATSVIQGGMHYILRLDDQGAPCVVTVVGPNDLVPQHGGAGRLRGPR